MQADLTLYAGGEDNFCTRHQVLAVQGMPVQGEPGLSQWGTLDRRELAARNVKTVLAETPAVIAGHAFTTGQIKRRTVEKVTGGARVEYAMKDGFGCNAAHFAPGEQLGKIVDDQHYHEHATCFNVKDRVNPDVIIPMHCSGDNFARAVRETMPDKLIQPSTGARLTFGA
jgi:7,8-dihydropterin-6-yl-methyl-4-(beta-D-ribofuranosyl)aminobenzene 5'-phosphate synthase